MSGKLTTHVLDTVRGCPAKAMAIAPKAVAEAIALWKIRSNPLKQP